MGRPLRIADFSIHRYSLPYTRPVRWFDSVETAGVYVLLKLVSTDGHVGIAEAPIRESWAGVSLRSLIAVLEDLFLPAAQAVDVASPEELARALGRFPENHLAKMLVDNACWSMRGHAAGVPLWKLWGGTQKVPLSWCVTRAEPEAMAEEALQVTARHGFKALKVKGGQGFAKDAAALKHIRKLVGDEVELYVDANCAYERGEAIDYVKGIADLGATIAEDPSFLAPDQQFTDLVKSSPVPILVDTQCASFQDAVNFLDHGATALSIKAGRIGLTETRRISELAESRGACVSPGMYAESALGSLVSLQLTASIKKPAIPAEISFFLMLREQVLQPHIDVVDGQVTLPDNPDLSSLVDWDRVARFSVD